MADEYTAASQGLPEDTAPLTAGEDFVPTVYGKELLTAGDAELTHGGTVESMGTAMTLDAEMLTSGLATTVALKAQLAGGLYNSDFAIGPPHPDEPLGENNALPYWRVGDASADGIPVAPLYWVEDADAPGGYSIQTRHTGPDGDNYRAFIEQVIPVAPGQRVLMPRGIWSFDDTYTGAVTGQLSRGIVQATFFDYAGNGLEPTNTFDPYGITDGGRPQGQSYPGIALSGQTHQTPREAALFPVSVPQSARYALIRYLFWSNSANGENEVLTLSEVSCREPRLRYVGLSFVHEDIAANTTVPWYLASHSTTVSSVNVGVEQYVTPAPGWVESISLNTNAARTAGYFHVQAFDADIAGHIGPYLTVDGTHKGNDGPRLYASMGPKLSTTTPSAFAGGNDAVNFFGPGEVLRVQSTSVGYAPTTADGVCHVTLALIDDYLPNNQNH
jgi:hypothetical protein